MRLKQHNIQGKLPFRCYILKANTIQYLEIRRKIQTFVNRCLRYILRIWWPKIISNKDLWRATGQGDINLEIWKKKI